MLLTTQAFFSHFLSHTYASCSVYFFTQIKRADTVSSYEKNSVECLEIIKKKKTRKIIKSTEHHHMGLTRIQLSMRIDIF